ncbi:MAG: ribonuclease D, partial [Microcoleus sp. SM1_3_4]|nr:ribonuclease D [Microcoleus sp. SM1_3_4]
MTNYQLPNSWKFCQIFQVCDRDISDTLLSYYLTSGAIAVDTETMGL